MTNVSLLKARQLVKDIRANLALEEPEPKTMEALDRRAQRLLKKGKAQLEVDSELGKVIRVVAYVVENDVLMVGKQLPEWCMDDEAVTARVQ